MFERICIAALLAASTPCLAVSAMHQQECNASRENEWLRQPTLSENYTDIESSRIRLIERDIEVATEMLREQSFVALRSDAVARFLQSGANPSVEGLRPYLVRAVYPTPVPQIQLSWAGTDLNVFAAGLGCAPFTKHPIIVFLERPPAEVFVMASAAL